MAKFNFNLEQFDPERLYDLRYRSGYNGMGSPVNVLTAESVAMTAAVRRLQRSLPEGEPITVVDFGSGTGRVPNELVSRWLGPGDLTVIAYDVSRVGLQRALRSMSAHLPTVTTYENTDRLVGECRSGRGDKYKRMIRFVHGSPKDTPQAVADLLVEENGGQQFDITTSWYDAVSHSPSRRRRRELFTMLGSITRTVGEMIITASTIGDFNAAYGDEPFEDLPPKHNDGDRDVVYQTEIGELSYVHLFGPGFKDHIRAARTDIRQNLWLQPIRMLDREYMTSVEEQEAYGRLRLWDDAQREKPWDRDTFATIHTVAGFRSPISPIGQQLL